MIGLFSNIFKRVTPTLLRNLEMKSNKWIQFNVIHTQDNLDVGLSININFDKYFLWLFCKFLSIFIATHSVGYATTVRNLTNDSQLKCISTECV